MLASPLAHSRVGVIVPKYKHSSVERNLVKRRLRELVRLRLLPALAAGPAADAVVRAAPAAYGAPFDALAAEVERVVRQLPRLLARPSAPVAPPTTAPPTVSPTASPTVSPAEPPGAAPAGGSDPA